MFYIPRYELTELESIEGRDRAFYGGGGRSLVKQDTTAHRRYAVRATEYTGCKLLCECEVFPEARTICEIVEQTSELPGRPCFYRGG